jgi:hypothetical protein
MKLAGAEARRYLAKPDPAKAALVIFGEDAMRVALKTSHVNPTKRSLYVELSFSQRRTLRVEVLVN